MNNTSRNDVELLTDRIEDLESHIIKLQSAIDNQKTVPKTDSNLSVYVFLVALPLTFLIVVLMGLTINYQSDKHQISYNSDGLVELSLSGITLLSGLYSLKKHHEKRRIERDKS